MQTGKIVYFDSETISNMLQEKNQGTRKTNVDTVLATESEGAIEAEAKVSLGVPFVKRLGFMFSGRLAVSYLAQWNKKTSITSTDISEFESLKKDLTHFESVVVKDIENSSTFFRVAGTLLRMYKGNVEDIDLKEFRSVMDDFDGYDTYKISEHRYLRFNTKAFVSNYKRNDLLATEMEAYCLPVGRFEKDQFDFIEQVNKMESLIVTIEAGSTLADFLQEGSTINIEEVPTMETSGTDSSEKLVELYDVVYAAIRPSSNK